MRERSVKNDETDYYRTRETPSTSPGTLGAIFGCPIGPGSGPGRTRRSERVTRRTPHGLGLTLFPTRGFLSARHRPSPCAGGGIKIPPETAPGGFLVPRDRQSEESRAISGNYYRNGTFPHRSAASLRWPTSAADATLSRRTMPPVSSLLLSH